MPQIPKPYLVNYTWGRSLGDAVSEAKADKLARDLQEQKLQQEMLMETQRQAMMLKRDELKHNQAKELTFEQRAFKMQDNEFFAKLDADAKAMKMKHTEYMFDKESVRRTDEILKSHELSKDLVTDQFKMGIAQQHFNNKAKAEASELANKRYIDNIEKEYGFKLDYNKDITEFTADVNDKMTVKQLDRTMDSKKDMFEYMLKHDPGMKKQQVELDFFKSQIDKIMDDTVTEKRMISSIGNWMQELGSPEYGFEGDPTNLAMGNMSTGNSAAIYKLLNRKMPFILEASKGDPTGQKHPALWASLRAQMMQLDQSMSGLGWGSLTSWVGSWWNKSYGEAHDIGKMMDYINRILSSQTPTTQK